MENLFEPEKIVKKLNEQPMISKSVTVNKQYTPNTYSKLHADKVKNKMSENDIMASVERQVNEGT